MSFVVRPTNVTELDRGNPAEVALENALRKAQAAFDPDARELVLGVDTLVALGNRIYGKPADESEARETLTALGGNTHTVFSGLALLNGEQENVAVVQTEVCFRACDEELIQRYVATGEWRGRAGGYAIQGDYQNVVGLPLATLIDMCPELF